MTGIEGAIHMISSLIGIQSSLWVTGVKYSLNTFTRSWGSPVHHKPLSPGMIWRDEYCEPYDELSSNHSPRTRYQATSTKDDEPETENYPHFSGDDSFPEVDTNPLVDLEQTQAPSPIISQLVLPSSDSVDQHDLAGVDETTDSPADLNPSRPAVILRSRRTTQVPCKFQDYNVEFKD